MKPKFLTQSGGPKHPAAGNEPKPTPPQKSGPPDFNPDTVVPGGRLPKADPKGDVGSGVGTPGGGRKPYKLG